MNSDQRLLVIGLYINSALYLSGCFVAGLVTHSKPAWCCALAAAGLSYLGYYAQLMRLSSVSSGAIVVFSVAFGLAAGLALLG